MNQKEGPDPNYLLSQRFVLGGLLHLEGLIRAMENPNLPISRRTAILGGLLLAGGGLTVLRLLEGQTKKEEPESILTPETIVNNERRRLTFYNATETPIILFLQNLERFLDQKRLTLPVKIGFLFQNHSQPQSIKDTDLTFYFNLHEKPQADLDLELSAHILTLLFLVSQTKTLKNSPSWQPENGFKLLPELSQTPIGNFYQEVLKELREGGLSPIVEIKRITNQ